MKIGDTPFEDLPHTLMGQLLVHISLLLHGDLKFLEGVPDGQKMLLVTEFLIEVVIFVDENIFNHENKHLSELFPIQCISSLDIKHVKESFDSMFELWVSNSQVTFTFLCWNTHIGFFTPV